MLGFPVTNILGSITNNILAIRLARISVDVDFMVELVDFKLRYLKEEIARILNKWNYDSSSKFLIHAKDGTLMEAEEDAIILKNLQDQIEELTQKKQEWKSI